jgi:hypothetical protein
MNSLGIFDVTKNAICGDQDVHSDKAGGMTKEQLIEGLPELFKDRPWFEACVKRCNLSIVLLDQPAGQMGACGPRH